VTGAIWWDMRLADALVFFVGFNDILSTRFGSLPYSYQVRGIRLSFL